MRRAWLWIVLVLLLVPLAAAHHRGGHDGGPGSDGGLIRIDLDPDDDGDDDGDDDRRDEERGDDSAPDDRRDGRERAPAQDQDGEPRCLQISANATRSGNAVAWQPGQPTSVYRASGSGDFRLIRDAGPDEGLLLDREVKKGTTYRYQATTGAAGDCPVVEVTAIPFMGGWTGLAVGAVAVAAHAAVRRR